MPRWMIALVAVLAAACGLVVTGVAMIYPPAGFITAGILLAALGIAVLVQIGGPAK